MYAIFQYDSEGDASVLTEQIDHNQFVFIGLGLIGKSYTIKKFNNYIIAKLFLDLAIQPRYANENVTFEILEEKE